MAESQAGRVLPHDLEAETSLLGSAILDADVLGQAAQILSPDDFFSPQHQTLYRALLGLYDRGEAIDLVLLKNELLRDGSLEKVGGIERLVAIAESVPSSANGPYYAEIVRDRAVTRRLIQSATEVLREAYEGGKPADELLDHAEQSVFAVRGDRGQGSGLRIGEILKETFERIDKMHERKGRLEGLETGFHELDDMTAGLQRSQLIIVAGRPSMGKTSFALTLASNIALREDKPVAIFSLETSRQQIAENLLCQRAGVDAHRLRKGDIGDDEWPRLTDAAGRLSEAGIFIDDTPGLSPLALKAKARRLKARFGVELLVVDYLQLMESGVARSEGRQQEIALISRSIKGIARELEIPVIALSQLNRSVDSREDHRPRLSDLRESGAIEQDADLILFLFREEYYEPSDENRGRAEVLVAKQRNGPTGKVDLQFRAACLRFENPSRPWQHVEDFPSVTA